MKIKSLIFKAFGPFTDKHLQLDSTSANLHVIYGPNEAGKSSALRAMGDLRFGIPQQSKDNFVHAHNRMAIVGVFVDAEGQEVAVARHKGRGQTLTQANPLTGEGESGVALPNGIEQALSGGLDRAQFESMFGLNHQRLREGGKSLLKGDNEVGSALFEASSGTASIKTLLATLEEDAKKYFSSRSHSATINKARRELEEQKRLYRDALTKPSEWKALERSHEVAKSEVEETEQALQALRRRVNELTELRTVQPLLKQHDDVLAELEALESQPLLPVNSRETRLAAEQAMRHASDVMLEASAELDECNQERAELTIEPKLLEHEVAINRLVVERDNVIRSREEQLNTQDEIESHGAQLTAVAGNISADQPLTALVAALPSAAERVSLVESLDQFSLLDSGLALKKLHLDTLQKRIKVQQAARSDAICDPVLLKAVASALRNAQTLGDFSKRQSDLLRDMDSLARSLKQALSDSGVDSVENLQKSRPLQPSELSIAEQELGRLETELTALSNEEMGISRDLKVQLRRQQTLMTTGEVVTALTLKTAREHRDDGWRRVRKAYVLRSDDPAILAQDFDPDRALPEAFEVSLSEADRQADVLRDNAERAATAAECESRVGEMNEQLLEINRLKEANTVEREEFQGEWSERLAAANLPKLQPAALREWLSQRAAALDLHERHISACRAPAEINAEVEQAAATLTSALTSASALSRDDASDLNSLMEQADSWHQTMIKTSATRESLEEAIKAQQEEVQEESQAISEDSERLQSCQSALMKWHERLFLVPESSPSVVKARLDELTTLAREVSEQSAREERIRKFTIAEGAFHENALNLAALLSEPEFAHVHDFVDRLQARLLKSKTNNSKLLELNRRESAAKGKHQAASERHDVGQASIKTLCVAAGVEAADGLEEIEALSEKKRKHQEQSDGLAAQLRQASTRSVPELRQRLEGLDIVSAEAERDRCQAHITEQETLLRQKEEAERLARQLLAEVDGSDDAAVAREAMESAVASYRAAIRPWAQLKLAESLLDEALRRFRERAQAPMLRLASNYFRLVTGGSYTRLIVDDSADQPVLQAERSDGSHIGIDAMSEGTADQLYLALRLAALELQRDPNHPMPLILDDVLITSDDARTENILRALAQFSEGGQVLLFTHHQHLLDLADAVLDDAVLATHSL